MAGQTAQVRLKQLRLSSFRNYQAVELGFQAQLVILTGENGAGKTNLLEAISFLTPGRGLRRASYEQVAKEGSEGGFAIHARLEGPYGATEIGTGTVGALPGETGRRIRINGAPARSAEALLEWLRVIWLTPAMDGLFTGPAADRRRFLDRMVLTIDAAHGQRALDYEKAMRGRNRLLAEDHPNGKWLEAIEAQMVETGVAIAAGRVELIRLLTAMIRLNPEDSPFPQALLSLQGSFEEMAAHQSATDVEERFREELARSRAQDRAAGRTLAGPHRSDLLVHHHIKAMAAEQCSTGEQKALLVGIVLSHARLLGEIAGQTPLVLLDEIAAHLDSRRRAGLFEILERMGCQTFMTGTDVSLFTTAGTSPQFLTIDKGGVLSGYGDQIAL